VSNTECLKNTEKQ